MTHQSDEVPAMAKSGETVCGAQMTQRPSEANDYCTRARDHGGEHVCFPDWFKVRSIARFHPSGGDSREAANRERAHAYAYGCELRGMTMVHSVGCDTFAKWLGEADARDAAHAAEVERLTHLASLEADAASALRADLAEQLPMRDADAMTISSLNSDLAAAHSRLEMTRSLFERLATEGAGATDCGVCGRMLDRCDRQNNCAGTAIRAYLATSPLPAGTR
jgi:hypothetical protein